MKYLSRFFLIAIGAIAFFSSCKKVDDLPVYGNGSAVTLTSSANSIGVQQADSASTAVTFSWSDPKYATALKNTKYLVEVDVAGNGFSDPITKTVIGALSADFTGAELNKAFFDHFGLSYGEVDMEARVTSSYINNNDQYVSAAIPVKFKPYPKMVAPPAGALFLVGGATAGGWGNPVPVPSQQFTKVDDFKYEGTFDLSGNGEFLVLPVNGSWDHKYAISGDAPADIAFGGAFGYDFPSNFKGPERTGTYKIVMDFYNGKFSVTQINALPAPENLFIVGGATPGGWGNPVPVPDQQFTKLSANVFEITVHLNKDDSYLLLPVNGSWDHKYGGKTALTGVLYADGDVPGSNTPSPAESGDYKITVNFDSGVYTLEKQ